MFGGVGVVPSNGHNIGSDLFMPIPPWNGREQVWANVVPIAGHHTYTPKHRCMLDTTLWIIQHEDA